MGCIFSLSEHTLEKDLFWLFDTVNAHIEKLSALLSGCGITSPGIVRRVGSRLVPYTFSGTVYLLFDYARGKQSLSREYIEDAMRKLADLLFSSALSTTSTTDDELDSDDDPQEKIDWGILKEHAVGTVYLAAIAKLKILDRNWINTDELEALTGFTPERALHQKIEHKTIDDVLLFEPRAIQLLLAKDAFSITTE